jgi:hypothetical protein
MTNSPVCSLLGLRRAKPLLDELLEHAAKRGVVSE